MSKGVRIVGALFGGLIGIGLVAGGGFGLRNSAPAYVSDDEVHSMIQDAGFEFVSNPGITVLIRATSGTLDPTTVSATVKSFDMLPNVKDVQSIPAFTNKSKTAALVLVTSKQDTDPGTARATLTDEVNQVSPQSGTNLSVLSPTDPPSWREPASWTGIGAGSLIIFASGAMAFAGTRRSAAPTGGQVPGFPAAGHVSGFPGTYPAPGPQPLPSQGTPAFQPVPYNAPFPPAN